jgi:hypothetical protein
MKTSIIITIGVLLLVILSFGYLALRPSNIPITPTVPAASTTTPPAPEKETPPLIENAELLTLAFGESGTIHGVTLTPHTLIEDSRCPLDVQCIWAGRVRITATITSGLGTAEQEFLVGEPITTEAEVVTLVDATPAKTTTGVPNADYRFTFKIIPQRATYLNTSSDMITVDTPHIGAVTGKTFTVTGVARGGWYAEGSFLIEVRSTHSETIAQSSASATGEWMTNGPTPFSANVTIPDSFTGPATLILRKANPSGLPERDASFSFPITIAY